jgi:DNA repair protein RadC
LRRKDKGIRNNEGFIEGMLIEVKEEQLKKQICDAEIVAAILRDILKFENEIDRDKEHFWVIGLNAKNIILYVDLVSLGTLTHSLIHPRETFRMAIIKAAASIIVGHNHPSGAPEPSLEDTQITERLKHAGEILGIKLLDHVIIGNNNQRYFSFSFKWDIENTLKNKNNKSDKAIKKDEKIQGAIKNIKEAASELVSF